MDMSVVRPALRSALEARGYRIGSDSHGLKREFYIMDDADDADDAVALFEIQPTAAEAFERMYQGSWLQGLPPRFAVLPAGEAASPSIEILEQARIVPLFFEMSEGEVRFVDFDTTLSRAFSP